MRTLKQIRTALESLAPTDQKAEMLLQWWNKLDRIPGDTDIVVTSILSQRTLQGIVELAVNKEIVQMDLNKAREVHAMLGAAIEAAISDQLLFRFLVEKVKIQPEQASMALLDFREMRQGSREVVFPS